MKLLISVFLIFILTDCSEAVEEFAFRKAVESDLHKECDDYLRCIETVSQQIKHCMKYSNWRVLLGKEENDPAFVAFAKTFRPYFKYPNGEHVFN